MIAIIVPAHNAEDHIDACLESLVRAARHPALAEDDVQITVVLDRCDDRTGWLARSWGVHTMDVEAGNVAVARKAGADAAVRAGARWLAFADAGSVVDVDWLAAQVAQGSEMVCRAVVDGALDTEHPSFRAANFGLSAKAYAVASETQLDSALAAPAKVEAMEPIASMAPHTAFQSPMMAVLAGGGSVGSSGSGGSGARTTLQAPFRLLKTL